MWSIFRTVLAVLSLLFAVTFVAVAAVNYGKRQSWAYAVLLHDVALKGLPLNNEELDAENRKIAEMLGESGKADVFAGQAGPVGTQLEEVNRYKQKLDGAIAGSTDKRTQLLSLARILTPLAISEGQREQLMTIRAHMADANTAEQLKADILRATAAAKDPKRKPAKPFDVAFAQELESLPGSSRAPFKDAFLAEAKKSPEKKPDELFEDSLEQLRQNLQGTYNEAFGPIVSGKFGDKDLADAERKVMIATLLFNLIEPMSEIDSPKPFEPGTPWDVTQGPYKRYLTVVGLEAAIQAIGQESVLVGQMCGDLRLEMDRDRSGFLTTHQDLVNQLQLAAADEAHLKDALSRQQDVLAMQQSLVNRRNQDIKLFQGDLTKLTKDTADILTGVRLMNDELYKVRIATRNANESNQKYEKQIRTLEAGR